MEPIELDLPATATEINALAGAYAQQHGCEVAIWVKGRFTGVNPSIGRRTFDHWQRVVGLESATVLTLTLALGNSGISIPMWINGPGRLRLAPEEKEMDRLTYSLAFEAIDPLGDLQTDTEGFIAAQLFDDWAEHTLFWHACRLILLAARVFCPQEDPPFETYTRLVQDVYDALQRWRQTLADAAGPSEEESAQAGRDLLLLILSRLKPEYIQAGV